MHRKTVEAHKGEDLPIRQNGPGISRHFARCVANHEDMVVGCYGKAVYVHSTTGDGYRFAEWAAGVWDMVETRDNQMDSRYVHESQVGQA